MELVKVKKNFQITLPSDLRKELNIKEGDYLDINKQDTYFIISPVKVIPSDQAYFHTKEWQEDEAEADKDIAEGNIEGPFDNINDALKALKAD
ncbi:Transcriptional regulator, AbrB family [Desulfamplus magnetovallimortis]|uniref:Transcriptional regulator, AbrB family n=1 Tax=Desulfamplus magnetovallimortis TaxID=1246637 RepID=A0A1W1HIY6_9BACT|nr:AbrB/MazE/SpoVT family DNA-binding domain-containing protein [Desulfamplus magnetovallimortis]MBF0235725.1 AbrB/MazE/SpoVT family DNA-binding domain-containing protein [Desulfamplus sp.]SLM32375.1 Transcriptional regulator, AbrB family [Desulfamplus magnetovallimortis]